MVALAGASAPMLWLTLPSLAIDGIRQMEPHPPAHSLGCKMGPEGRLPVDRLHPRFSSSTAVLPHKTLEKKVDASLFMQYRGVAAKTLAFEAQRGPGFDRVGCDADRDAQEWGGDLLIY
jgi:hypothetical protein